MSTLYNLEPPPTGKVLLKTTSGDLTLEIFAKQTPLASRNFLQHCLDGYYDNTIFHRLVPGFIIQGGDPTGLGTGGVSALDNGAPFADEFHSRLRFNRRGLLGMANSGDPNDNTSQFFLTLDKTPELQGKNTMFGRIEGDTIYNLMKMGEADLAEEDGDRPLYPTKVTGTEVLLNPFEDMVKRVLVAARSKEEDSSKTGKKKRKAGKTLLSFGADEGDDGAPVIKKAKVNPSFKTTGTDNGEGKPKAAKAHKRRTPSISASPEPAKPSIEAVQANRTQPDVQSLSPEPEQVTKTMTALEKTNAQIAELKASMKRNVGGAQKAPEKKLSALEAMIPTTSTRGRKKGKVTDERGALDMFNAFRSRLGTIPQAEQSPEGAEVDGAVDVTASAAANGVDGEEKLCDLHFIANCQSCTAWDDEGKGEADDDGNDPNWMSHQLSFAKDNLGKDLEWRKRMEDFEVIDPREKAKEILGDKGKGRQKSGKEWDRPQDKDGRRSKA